MPDHKKKDFQIDETEKDQASSFQHNDYESDNIKDAHATGVGSLGRNDEKLGSDEKEEAGIIKD